MVIVVAGQDGFTNANHFDVVGRVVVCPLGLVRVARDARQVLQPRPLAVFALLRPEPLQVVALEEDVVGRRAAPVPILIIFSVLAVSRRLFRPQRSLFRQETLHCIAVFCLRRAQGVIDGLIQRLVVV